MNKINRYVNIYPNPIENSMVNIEVEQYAELRILLADVSGRNIMSRPIYRGSNQINLEGLEKGLYFLKVVREFDGISECFLGNCIGVVVIWYFRFYNY